MVFFLFDESISREFYTRSHATIKTIGFCQHYFFLILKVTGIKKKSKSQLITPKEHSENGKVLGNLRLKNFAQRYC